MFDPFFTTKPAGKGTGLGLSIVHKAINEASGLLDVHSLPGVGTTFSMLIPVANAGPEVADSSVQSDDVPELSFGTGRILLVDDEEYVLDFTQDCLEAAGYEVLPARSAEEALRVLADLMEPPELLFTDFNMGRMTGLELISRVNEMYPGMRFVLASGYLEDTERLLLEQYDCRVLQKPFELEDATRVVAEQMERE